VLNFNTANSSNDTSLSEINSLFGNLITLGQDSIEVKMVDYVQLSNSTKNEISLN